MEPNTKLFPAVFVRPTSPNLFQFELAKIKVETLFHHNQIVLYWVELLARVEELIQAYLSKAGRASSVQEP